MVAKPGSLAPHSLIKWTWSGVKLFGGLLNFPVSYFLAWLGMKIFILNMKDALTIFYHTMLSSRNPVVSFIATKALHNTLGPNRAFLSVKYQDGGLIRDFLVPLQRTLGSGDAPRVEQIRELIRARVGSGIIENFQVEEIILVLDYVSTYWCLCYVWKKIRFFTKGIGSGVGWGVVLGWYGFD